MAETFRISHGDFRVEIVVEQLPGLSFPKIRTLFRLMAARPTENAEALRALPELLQSQVDQARQSWKQSGTCKAGYDRWVKIQSIYKGELNP